MRRKVAVPAGHDLVLNFRQITSTHAHKPNRTQSHSPAAQADLKPEPVVQSEEPAIQFAIALLQGKWRISILQQLQNGSLRLSELKRRLSPVSKKVLNQHLRQMEIDGLLVRTDLSNKVPYVEYSLTNPGGYAALQLLQLLAQWSAQNSASEKKDDIATNEQKASLRTRQEYH